MFKNANFFITEFFKSLIGKQTSEEITPKSAIAIQKQEYFNTITSFDKTYTPPYLLIGYQLFNDKQDIFEAAVHYLCIIANNNPKYRKDISNILITYCNNNKKLTDRISFIHTQMNKFIPC